MCHTNCRKAKFSPILCQCSSQHVHFCQNTRLRSELTLSADRKSTFKHVFACTCFFFYLQETEECFEVSTDVKGYESSCKNISLRLPPMQQALCVCVSKTDPVAAVPSPYPATTPPPPPMLTASLCEVWFCCQYQKTACVHLDTQHTPVTAAHVEGTSCSPLF